MNQQTVKTSEIHEPPAEHILFTQDEEHHQFFTLLMSMRRELERNRKKAYNYTHPVDEYADIPAGSLTRTLQPEYTIGERYESILYSIGVGATSATLTLGKDRNIVLYSGAALATQLVGALPFLGIVLNADDERTITFTGATTTGSHVALFGHAISKDSDD